jgi:hypothetical protein
MTCSHCREETTEVHRVGECEWTPRPKPRVSATKGVMARDLPPWFWQCDCGNSVQNFGFCETWRQAVGVALLHFDRVHAGRLS